MHHFDQAIDKKTLKINQHNESDFHKHLKHRRLDVLCEDLDLSGAMEKVACGVVMKVPLACYTALQVCDNL